MDELQKYLQLAVTEQLIALGASVQTRFERAARASGLAPREGRVLIHLGAAHTRKQGALAADIAKASGLAASHVSQAIAQLVRRGLVIVPEVQDVDDRRLKRVYLSTEGKRALMRLQHLGSPIEDALRRRLRFHGSRSSRLDQAVEAVRAAGAAE